MGGTDGYSVSEKELKVTVGTAAWGAQSPLHTGVTPEGLHAHGSCPRSCALGPASSRTSSSSGLHSVYVSRPFTLDL